MNSIFIPSINSNNQVSYTEVEEELWQLDPESVAMFDYLNKNKKRKDPMNATTIETPVAMEPGTNEVPQFLKRPLDKKAVNPDFIQTPEDVGDNDEVVTQQ